MIPKFICHPDFAEAAPRDVFYKEIYTTKEKMLPSTEVDRHILFRKKITLGRINSAILNITADDYYKLYINGRFVTQGPAPSYPNAYYYNQIDVTGFLREGENTFAVHTYYQGLINRVWVSGDMRQMLWCSLETDGVTALVSDESWSCADHTGFTECGTIAYSTAFAEFYHSTAPEVGFERPDFDDSHWQSAAIRKNADYTLIKQPTRQLEFETILPKTITPIEGGARIDFGKEAVGYLCAKAKGNSGDVVNLRFGEELNDDGSVRYIMRCNCVYSEQWELSGGDDTLDQFDYKGFRYVEILYPESARLEDISFIARHYPFRNIAKFDTDNERLKSILTLCADTIKYGTQEVLVDCPTREKGQYLGDVSVSGRAQAVLTGSTDMIKKAIMDFCHTTFICKGIMAVSTSSWMQEIADYTLQFPAQIMWVYAMDTDMEFLRTVEPYVMGLYDYLTAYENADGLLEDLTDKWNLVDWPKNLRDDYDFDLSLPHTSGRGIHNVVNAFWCGYLSAMDEYLTAIGKSPTGKTQRARSAFIKSFYSKESGLFCDTPQLTHSSIHSNVLPLLFDIGTENKELCERITQFIRQKKLTSMGVYMSYFTLAALINHGKRDVAEELALDEGCWLNMLREGGTTTFEAWGKDQKKNCSLFHPWATAPLVVFADIPRIY